MHIFLYPDQKNSIKKEEITLVRVPQFSVFFFCCVLYHGELNVWIAENQQFKDLTM